MTEEELHMLVLEELKKILYSTDTQGPEEDNPFGIFY